LLVLGGKTGSAQADMETHWPRIDSIPFESENRFMATSHSNAQGEPWIYVKGAPERILDICSHQRSREAEQPIDRDYWRRMATDTAAQGLRLLALASKCTAPAGARLRVDDIHEGFTLLALVGIID